MKTKNKDYIIAIYLMISFISLLFIPYYFGLHIPTPLTDPLYIAINVIGALFIVVTIEFGVIYGFLRKADLVVKDLFISVLLVNFITFLPAQIFIHLLLAFSIQFAPVFMITVFIIVLSTEWLLYRLKFQKLLKSEPLNMVFSTKKILLASTVANLITGSLTYIYPSTLFLLDFFIWSG